MSDKDLEKLEIEKEIRESFFPKISLCIPTMDRYNTFLKNYLPKYLNNKYIDEIVICDENGNDNNFIMKDFGLFNSFDYSKIKCYKNEVVLGAFKNKEKVVSLASNDYVALIDSDNFVDESYFEAFKNFIEKNGLDDKTIYCPSFTNKQNNHSGFNYTHIKDVIITKENCRLLRNIDVFLNTGNYIFNKKNYNNDDFKNHSLSYLLNEEYSVDVLLQNALMLRRGCKLVAVPNMSYDHLIHDGSLYMKLSSLNIPNINVPKIMKIYDEF